MKRNITIVCAIWIVLVGTSFVWNYFNARNEKQALALQSARSFFEQVLITRSWNALHGGVYVPVTNATQPNPYLEDPRRDIEVDADLKLTKINPSFMTRQISELAEERQSIRFHMTSLNPIRPANKPTAREEMALHAFASGTREVGEMTPGKQGRMFFYMAPLITEKACLDCHAKQGYQEGEIRGGLSVTFPFESRVPLVPLVGGHLAIGLVGLMGILFAGKTLDRANAALRKQAVMDDLTGIPNRRSLSERILTEFDLSRRGAYPLSVIMGDVDLFKLYNDTYGHRAGDECLIKVAQTIQMSLKRPGDFCARYGGEEFVILLPNTPQQGALKIADEIRMNVFNLGLTHEKSPHAGVASISFGVATATVDDSMKDDDLLKKSDQALYLAKEKGRNRVEVYSETVGR